MRILKNPWQTAGAGIVLALILNVNVRWVPSFGKREFEGEPGEIPRVGLDPLQRNGD